MDDDNLDVDLAAIGSLTDPTRRRLYAFVASPIEPVGRDEAADALGIPRQTAAYHLDRLADEGLVDVEFLRLSGRTGPGAGRPAKLYRGPARSRGVTASAPVRARGTDTPRGGLFGSRRAKGSGLGCPPHWCRVGRAGPGSGAS